MDDVPLEERARRNFDRPDSLDWPLIEQYVEALARGESIAEPIYLFAPRTLVRLRLSRFPRRST
jgi:uridine kinase